MAIWRRSAAWAVAVGAWMGLTPSAQAQPDALMKVEVNSFAELRELQSMGLDVLTERPGPGWVDVRVPGSRRSLVAVSGLHTQTVVENLTVETRPTADHTAPFFDDFRRFEEIQAHLDSLATDHPDLVEAIEIGRSLEDRPLTAIRISNAPDDAPTLLVTAGLHAREWIAISSGVCVADSLATRATEPEFAALLEEVHFVVVPLVNPDGYVYTWDEERFWRKNRRDGVGVDLNRNFSIGFGGPGSRGNPDALNYRGTEAFSEPESAALRDLAEDIGDVRSHLDVHSFGQLVLRPWGHVTEDPPAQDILLPLSETLADQMTAFDGESYVPLSGTDLYPAAGNSQDWAYGALGAMSFTLELRPSEVEVHAQGFVLPPERIEDVCLETMAAVLELADWTASSEPGSPGDTGDLPEPMGTTTGASGSTGGDDFPDPAATSSGTTGAAPSSGGGTTGSSPDDPDDPDDPEQQGEADGCGCHAPERERTTGLLVLAAIGALGRRRRTSLSRSAPRA